MTKENVMLPMVAVVDPNDADRAFALDLLINSGKAQVAGASRELGELDRLMVAEPDIVLLDMQAVLPASLSSAVRQVHDMSPRCEVILTASSDVPLDISDAVQAGARGLLRKRLAVSQLVGLISGIFEAEQLKRQHFEQLARAAGTGERDPKGRFIAVYSPKGGVGCTTIATNLALAIGKTAGARVALADFDLQFGDVDVLLDLHSSHGVHELAHSIDDLDASILDAVMVRHVSGLTVLLPPSSLDLVDHLTPDALVAVLKALRKQFDYVVVDTWHSVEEITLAIMELADLLIVVTTPEIPALRDTRRLLDLLEKRPETRNKMQIVVNRYPSKSAVSLEAIQRSFRIKPMGTIPSDGHLITAAINEGTSFLSGPSEAANSLTQLAALVAGPGAARAKPDDRASAKEEPSGKRGLGLFRRTATT